MNVPPVPGVGDKKAGKDPELLHLLQLIPAQDLGVDHDRPHTGQAGLFQCGRIGVDHLLRGGISVAVDDDLCLILERLNHKLFDRCIRMGWITPIIGVISEIGFAEPGGAPLWRTVEEDLVAADPKMLPVFAPGDIPLRQRAALLQIEIADNIPLQ